jgi:hypothetical protein
MYSQTDSCTIPCKALKNALLVKVERDDLKNKLSLTQDSIKIFNSIVYKQDSIIKNNNTSFDLYNKNKNKYDSLIINKNDEINIYKNYYETERKFKYIGYGAGILGIILSIIL